MNSITDEYVLWLKRAEDDLKWTKANLKEGIYYGACFTAQQAVEKTLKAFLLFRQGRFDKIHDLVRLIDLCIQLEKTFQSYKSKVAAIALYYVQTRYPDITDIDVFTKVEAESAYGIAKEIVQFTSKLVLSTGKK